MAQGLQLSAKSCCAMRSFKQAMQRKLELSKSLGLDKDKSVCLMGPVEDILNVINPDKINEDSDRIKMFCIQDRIKDQISQALEKTGRYKDIMGTPGLRSGVKMFSRMRELENRLQELMESQESLLKEIGDVKVSLEKCQSQEGLNMFHGPFECPKVSKRRMGFKASVFRSKSFEDLRSKDSGHFEELKKMDARKKQSFMNLLALRSYLEDILKKNRNKCLLTKKADKTKLDLLDKKIILDYLRRNVEVFFAES